MSSFDDIPPSPAPRGTADRFPALFVGLVVGAAVMLASGNLAAPGLYYDETLFCNAALGAPLNSFVDARIFGWPLLLMPYLGALKAWLYYPVFSILPVNPWTIRLPAIMLGVAGAVLLVRATHTFFGRKTTYLAAPLVLFDPGLLMHSRLDWGPDAVMFLLRGAVVCSIAHWWKHGTPTGIWMLIGAGAAGTFDKLNFIWILAGAMAALVAVFPKRCVEYCVRHPVLALVQAQMLGGVLLFSLWRATLVSATLGTSEQGWAARCAVAARLLYFTIIGGGPLQFVCGSGLDLERWMVPAYLLAVCVCLVGWAWRLAGLGAGDDGTLRPFVFACVFTLLVGLGFVLTKAATGPHHAAVISGLPGFILAPLLAGLVGPRVWKPLPPALSNSVVAGTVLLLTSAMIASSATSVHRFRSPTHHNWDPAHNLLGEVCAEHPDALYRTADWGMGTQMIALTGGRVAINDNWPEFLDPATARAALLSRDADQDLYLCTRAVGFENFPDANRGLMAALHELGIDYAVDRHLTARDGRPLITVLHVPPVGTTEPRTRPGRDRRGAAKPLIVKDWGPRETVAGTAFNQQATGESAMWISLDGHDPDTSHAISFDGHLIDRLVRMDFGFTFCVPSETYGTPGPKEILLLAGPEKKPIWIGVFDVKPGR
jgi:hypothetical protein